MKRWIGRSTLVALSSVVIVAAGGVSAQASCPLLDPLCVVEETVDEGVGLVDDVVDLIETPVDDVVDPVIDTIVGTVDDVLGGGPVDLPDPPGGSGNGGGSHLGQAHQGGSGAGTPGPKDQRRPGSEIVVPGLHQRPEFRRFVEPIQLPRPVSDPTGSSAAGSVPAGAVLGAVARSLAIVLVLFGLVVSFAAIQDRLDRNDPRLALAPMRSDEVTFG